MILIDMHVHSTYSDGTFTVDELVRMAKRRNLAFISLSDHDTTAGIPPFMLSCRKFGVEGLPGIELSAEANYPLHILGFRIKLSDVKLEQRLTEIRNYRDLRNYEICRKLQKLGFDIQIEEVAALSNGQVVARPHIARLMIQKGYVSTLTEAFIKYIGLGGSAYVPRVRLTAEECISLIDGAGGLAVLAHPAKTYLDEEGMEKLIRRLKNSGLWGIEALYSGHSPEQTYNYLMYAHKFGLFSTAGSDFHGANGSVTDLGIPVSEDFLPWARLGIKI